MQVINKLLTAFSLVLFIASSSPPLRPSRTRKRMVNLMTMCSCLLDVHVSTDHESLAFLSLPQEAESTDRWMIDHDCFIHAPTYSMLLRYIELNSDTIVVKLVIRWLIKLVTIKRMPVKIREGCIYHIKDICPSPHGWAILKWTRSSKTGWR